MRHCERTRVHCAVPKAWRCVGLKCGFVMAGYCQHLLLPPPQWTLMLAHRLRRRGESRTQHQRLHQRQHRHLHLHLHLRLHLRLHLHQRRRHLCRGLNLRCLILRVQVMLLRLYARTTMRLVRAPSPTWTPPARRHGPHRGLQMHCCDSLQLRPSVCSSCTRVYCRSRLIRRQMTAVAPATTTAAGVLTMSTTVTVTVATMEVVHHNNATMAKSGTLLEKASATSEVHIVSPRFSLAQVIPATTKMTLRPCVSSTALPHHRHLDRRRTTTTHLPPTLSTMLGVPWPMVHAGVQGTRGSTARASARRQHGASIRPGSVSVASSSPPATHQRHHASRPPLVVPPVSCRRRSLIQRPPCASKRCCHCP